MKMKKAPKPVPARQASSRTWRVAVRSDPLPDVTIQIPIKASAKPASFCGAGRPSARAL
jgi:hypothetical protein